MMPPPRQPVPMQPQQGGPMGAGMPQGGPVAAPMPGQGAPMQPQAPQVPGGPQQGFGGAQIAYMPPPAPSQPIPPPMGAPTEQNKALFARAASAKPGKVKAGQMKMTPAELAAMGRLGDTTIAHLTPGEIAVPPQVQTPQVKAALGQAFQQAGVSPQQFVAGSPQSSINPQSGVPEYSFWSAILPVLGAAAGSFLAPGIGTAAGMALGGAAGGGIGALVDHATPTQALLSMLGGGAGGYAGGGGLSGLFGGAGEAAAGAAGAAQTAAPTMVSDLAMPFGEPVVDAGAWDVAQPATQSTWDQIKAAPWRGAMLAGLGSSAGGMFAPAPQQQASTPPGFGSPMTPLNTNPNSILGNSNSPTPNFAGYNPYLSASGTVYDFYRPRQ